MKNLVQRTVSGILYLVILIGSFFLGKFAFGALFLFIGLLALIEFYHLMELRPFSAVTIIGLIIGTIWFILAFLVASQAIPLYWLSLALILPVFALIWNLYDKSSSTIADTAKVMMGLLYIILPLAMLNYLVFPGQNAHLYTHRIALGIMILVWINDTGAYVSGMLLGSHKMFPRISPKKSWEGLAGGTLFTLLPAFWMNRIMGILTMTDWIILAVMVCIFGIYGDLTESLFKRNAGKKDSGNLIPGHGGVLDRFDSILFVVPVASVYLLIWG